MEQEIPSKKFQSADGIPCNVRLSVPRSLNDNVPVLFGREASREQRRVQNQKQSPFAFVLCKYLRTNYTFKYVPDDGQTGTAISQCLYCRCSGRTTLIVSFADGSRKGYVVPRGSLYVPGSYFEIR